MEKYGKWIWNSKDDGINQYVDFIDFFTAKKGEDCVVKISADTNYCLFVNGEYVYSGQYSDFPSYKIFDSFNVSELLADGENKLAILAYYCGEGNSVYFKGSAKLWYNVEKDGVVVASSDKNTLSRADRGYLPGEIEKISAQLGYNFAYNAAADDLWQSPNCNDGFSLSIEKDEKVEVIPRPIKTLQFAKDRSEIRFQGDYIESVDTKGKCAAEVMQNSFIKPKTNVNYGFSNNEVLSFPCEKGLEFVAEKTSDGFFIVVDLLNERAGFISLDFQTERECDVLIGYGEHLEDGRCRTAIDGRNFGFLYKAKKGRQTFATRLKRCGCRFIQVFFNTASPVKISDINLIQTNYPLEEKEFKTSDRMMARMYSTGVNTLRLCMHEHHEDCPWREQALYGMDSRNQMLYSYYVFKDSKVPQASLELFSKNLRTDGLIALCANSETKLTIPSFSLYYLMAIAENLEHTNDKVWASSFVGVVEKVIQPFIDHIDETGLIPVFTGVEYWNFYEWQDGLDGKYIFRDFEIPLQYDSTLNILLVQTINKLRTFYKTLGLNCPKWGQVADYLPKLIVDKFFDKQEKILKTTLTPSGELSGNHELTAALALENDCAIGVETEVLNALISGKLLKITLANKLCEYEALIKFNKKDYVLNNIEEVFGKMILSGNKTFYETEKGAADFYLAGSLCHGWSAVPCYIFQKYNIK